MRFLTSLLPRRLQKDGLRLFPIGNTRIARDQFGRFRFRQIDQTVDLSLRHEDEITRLHVGLLFFIRRSEKHPEAAAQEVYSGVALNVIVALILRARRDEMSLLVLVGERLVPYAEDLRAGWARDLAAGQETALSASESLDRLLLCVKCFR